MIKLQDFLESGILTGSLAQAIFARPFYHPA
jgi:hypothetical protein